MCVQAGILGSVVAVGGGFHGLLHVFELRRRGNYVGDRVIQACNRGGTQGYVRGQTRYDNRGKQTTY